jgi:hypothetical protein
MSNNLLTQEGLLIDLRKRKQLENVYKKKMAKVQPFTPDLQAIQNKFIVSETDLPQLRRQPNETEDDYNARIEELKTNNSEVLEKYYTQNIEKLRNNLKTMVPNQQKLNELVQNLSIDPEDIIIMNNYFKKFKQTITDNFDSISYDDFINYIDKFISVIKNTTIKDKSKEFENISLNINDEVKKFIKSADVVMNKQQPNKYETIPEVPYDATKFPDLNEFGVPKRIAEMIEAQKKATYENIIREKINTTTPDMLKEKSYDIAKARSKQIAKVKAEKEAKLKAEKEAKLEAAKELDDKKSSIDPTSAKVEVIEGDKIVEEEATSSTTPAIVEKLDEKDKGFISKEDVKPSGAKETEEVPSLESITKKIAETDSGFVSKDAKEDVKPSGAKEMEEVPSLESITKKIAETDSGFVSKDAKDAKDETTGLTFEESDVEETPKVEETLDVKEPDVFNLEKVKQLLQDAIDDTTKPYTSFVKEKYKDRYIQAGRQKSENNKFNKYMDDLVENISDNFGRNEALRFKKGLQGNLSKADFNKYIVPYVMDYKNRQVNEKNRSEYEANTSSRKIFGFGLSKSNQIVPIQFGRYILNKNKLDNQNLLQVLHENSLNQVKFFKSTYISDDMKDLIYYIVEKKSFSQKLYKLLDSSEQDLFNMLLDKSGLKKQLNINLGSSKYSDVKKMYKDLKEQYEILTSQIESGNDSYIVQRELNKNVKELKQIITHLAKVGEISKSNATNMILSL